MILVSILAPLLFMALLITFKVRLELVLPAGALLLAILFHMPVLEAVTTYSTVFISLQYVTLFCVIFFVMLLGELMEKGRMLTQMASIFLKIFKDNRLAAAASAGFIGLLPMPGGSLLSAPFVDKLLPGDAKEQRLTLNYWFRHVWEYFYPLYSGMAWIITVMKVPPLKILLYMGPMSIIMVLSGLWLIKGSEKQELPELATSERPVRILMIMWPILFAVSVSLAGVPLALAIIASVTLFVAVNRRLVTFVLPFVFSKKTLFTVFMAAGIIYFERIVREAGVAHAIYQSLGSYTPALVVFFLPLLIGLLTGISIAFISIAFPILAPFLMNSGMVDMPLLTLAYIGGFTGVMLSPTHLCLIVTTDFFKTTLAGVYPSIVRSSLVMAAAGWAYFALITLLR